MNNSIAVWVNRRSESSHLHVNYWIVKQRFKPRDHFLDIGTKLKAWGGGKIFFYFPLNLISENVIELGSELKNQELSNALFNEHCTITQGQAPKKFDIQFSEEKLTVFTFDKQNDLKIDSLYGGSVVEIKVPDEVKDWYIRFRVRSNFNSEVPKIFKHRKWRTVRGVFSENHTPKGSFYQSVRNSVDAIDFRLNDKRTLDPSLLDEHGADMIKFEKINFFLINDQKEDLSFYSVKPKKIRLLEHEVWNNYLENVSGDKRKYCATHWSCSPNESWEVFSKIRFSNSNYRTILQYLFFAIIFAGLINMASAITYERYKEKINSTVGSFLNSSETVQKDNGQK